MHDLPDLMSDLALILIVAGIVTVLFKWLKQPVVLGYIVAGFFVGTGFMDVLKEIFGNVMNGQFLAYLKYYPQVLDTNSIHTWSKIGVIFLLFALGLEFSFKKLMEVGGTAFIAGAINMVSMIVIGYLLGQMLHLSHMNSVFLGGMLSMSSTTIIIKAFNDMNLQKKKFAGIVFGMLIVEDIAAILMMVLLATVATSQNIGGMELLNDLLKLVFFMLIWFVGGIYLVPSLLKAWKKYLNDETLLIVSVGMCLGMVLFAQTVHFSPELGAFIMGSILAETIESKRIEHLTEPLKNFFGAVFFVSVGMMIVPSVLVEHFGTILLFTVVILVGRVIFATIGVSASGQGLKVAMQSGFSLAQIGEFSFIIAALGISLGVLEDWLYPVIIAVSVITTFTTPYCIKYSTTAYEAVEKRIPVKWNKLITGYASSNYKSLNDQTAWNKLLKSILSSVAVYFTVAIAILLICRNFIIPIITASMHGVWGNVLGAIITLILMAPFLRAIIMKKNHSKEFKELWSEDKHFNKGALISLLVFRVGLCILLILMLLIPLFPSATVLMVVVSLIFIVFIIYTQGFKNQSRRIEARFMENFNMKEQFEAEKRPVRQEFANDLLSKNVHIEDYDIPADSSIVGRTLRDLNFKQKTGVNIVRIIRGSKKINIPDGNECLFPMDKIVVIGSDEELQTFEQMIDQHHNSDGQNALIDAEYIDMSQYIIEEGSPMIGKSIKDLKTREKSECMIIAIDRDEHGVMDINADTVLEVDDVLWIAGEVSKIDKFGENIQKDL